MRQDVDLDKLRNQLSEYGLDVAEAERALAREKQAVELASAVYDRRLASPWTQVEDIAVEIDEAVGFAAVWPLTNKLYDLCKKQVGDLSAFREIVDHAKDNLALARSRAEKAKRIWYETSKQLDALEVDRDKIANDGGARRTTLDTSRVSGPKLKEE